ncbi:MAG: hypothetical protein AVDCRST_MAG13-223, partial [uncultured Solirubrobacteraceae bacterium]
CPGRRRRRRPRDQTAAPLTSWRVTTSAPRTIRLARPATTLPGPMSMKRVAPAAAMASTVATQRTGRTSACASSARTSSNGLPVDALNGVMAAGCSSTSASAAEKPGTAGSMAREWNAPATSSAMTRRPRSRATAPTSLSAAASPDRTIWPGALWLASASSCSSAASLMSSAPAPRTASMLPPGRASAASAMSRPRRTTSSSASSRASTPAAASAASSPREWPATPSRSRSPSGRRLQPAMLAQKIAGWAKRVLSAARGKGSSPTSAAARSSRSGAVSTTAERASAGSEPWPGKSATEPVTPPTCTGSGASTHDRPALPPARGVARGRAGGQEAARSGALRSRRSERR